MAKTRQTNVNINYTVNTVDIERGNGLLAKASKATDDLKKSSDAYAKTASAGSQKVSTSIAGMTLQMQRLKAQIELTNKSDTQRLAQLAGQYKAIKAQVDAYNRSLFQTNTATKQTAASTKGLAGQFGEVYTAIKLVIAAGLARELVNMSLSAATLTGNVEGVERAFTRAFPQGTSLMIELRRATHGAVNDFELMQRTLQATNLGVSVEHLPVLFEFAAARAQQTGESVDYLVDSIVRGIGRKSVLVLDNLGLSTTRLKQQFDGAAIASKSVGEVTQGVAEIARFELDKMGGYLETSKTHVDQLSVAWRELREEAAKALTSGGGGGLIGQMKEFVRSFRIWIQSMNEGRDVSELFAEEQRKEIAAVSANEFMTRRFTKSREENIAILKEEIQAITEDLGVYTRFRDPIEDVIAQKKEELKVMESRLKVDRAGQKIKTAEFIETEQFLELNERILKSKKSDALIDQEILKILQSKLTALKAVNKEQEKGEGDGKRGLLMGKDLFQIVDIRYKDPKTGAVTKEHNNKVLQDFTDGAQEVINALPPVQLPITPYIPMTEWEKAWEANKDALIDLGGNILSDQVNSIMRAEVDRFDILIEKTQEYYDKQIELAGDNERVKNELRIKEDREIKKLEKERADREKKAAKAGIKVSTALGIMKVFTENGLTFADKLIKAAIVAATGASQLIAADRVRYYAKGDIDIKGGTPGKDSIPAMLMPHESVMTAEETASSHGILRAVRARKLNDKVMQEIVSGRSGGSTGLAFDDSRLLKKLDEVKASQPDIIKRANLAYEIRKTGDNYKKIIRSKSIRS